MLQRPLNKVRTGLVCAVLLFCAAEIIACHNAVRAVQLAWPLKVLASILQRLTTCKALSCLTLRMLLVVVHRCC